MEIPPVKERQNRPCFEFTAINDEKTLPYISSRCVHCQVSIHDLSNARCDLHGCSIREARYDTVPKNDYLLGRPRFFEIRKDCPEHYTPEEYQELIRMKSGLQQYESLQVPIVIYRKEVRWEGSRLPRFYLHFRQADSDHENRIEVSHEVFEAINHAPPVTAQIIFRSNHGTL